MTSYQRSASPAFPNLVRKKRRQRKLLLSKRVPDSKGQRTWKILIRFSHLEPTQPYLGVWLSESGKSTRTWVIKTGSPLSSASSLVSRIQIRALGAMRVLTIHTLRSKNFSMLSSRIITDMAGMLHTQLIWILMALEMLSSLPRKALKLFPRGLGLAETCVAILSAQKLPRINGLRLCRKSW